MRKIAFIDRDGTLVEEPSDFQVDRLDKIKWVKGAIPNLLALQKKNYELVMVTNQDGLGTSSFPTQDFDLCHDFIMNTLASQGIVFNEVLICPHLPKEQCQCRKPNLGLLTDYLHQFDPTASFVAGDRPSDGQLAQNLGVTFFDISTMSWDQIAKQLFSKNRQAQIQRQTKETKIELDLVFDGLGESSISTGLPFYDHMLEQIAKHSGISTRLECVGDLHVDDHHTVEDVAIALGQGLKKALGDRFGIQRYGFLLPMDEVLVHCAIDLSGRPFSQVTGSFNSSSVGGFATEMVPHFFKSLSQNLGASIHIEVKNSGNTHHQVEACFKSFALCLKQAVQVTGSSLASTKGVL